MAQPFTLYKLIVLYMLSRVDYPLTNSQISEFILNQEYTDYFSLQRALSEMLLSHLLQMEKIRNTSYYNITDMGNSTLDFFINEISPDIRKDVDNFLSEQGLKLRREVSAIADYCRLTTGGYSVRMQLKERSPVMDLTVVVPTESAAKAMCNNWSERCHDMYGEIIDLLL